MLNYGCIILSIECVIQSAMVEWVHNYSLTCASLFVFRLVYLDE